MTTTATTSSKVLIGADPELFLVDKDGKFISSIGLIGGTKKKPKDIGNGCAIQEDNVAVEFNIAPAEDVDAFIAGCEYALNHLTTVAAEKGLFLSITASKSFSEDQLDNPKAKVFGCDADFNAWTRKMNKPPKAKDPNLRSAGGHIHFGVEGLDRIQLARWSDVLLGLPSLFEDSDTQRRSLYGSAGCFRPKPYGVEYRTLSNYWLKEKELMKKVYERARAVVTKVSSGKELSDNAGRHIMSAINESNKILAQDLMHKYGITL